MSAAPSRFAVGLLGILELVDRVCPLLGLAAERGVAIDGVDAGHRCHAEDPPAPLERGIQAQLCLTAAHERCDRYLAFAGRIGAASPGRTRLADGLVTTRLVLAPQPAWRGMAGRARASRVGPWVGIGAVVAGVGIAGAVVAAPLFDGPPPDTLAAADTTPPARTPRAVIATPDPTAAASPPRAATPSPSAVPTAAPTATPAPTPAPTPVPPRTYTVARGDTLGGIAQRFGTTPGAIQQANGIDDPDEIVIGQVLVIP